MKSLPRWLTLTLSAVLVVGVGLYAWLASRHDDVVTWDARISWEHAPLRVSIGEGLAQRRDAIRAAMRFWDAVGCVAFVEGEPADVYIDAWEGEACGRPSDRLEPGMGGTWACAGGVHVLLDNIPEDDGFMLAVTHELGHALGLQHQRSGIMAPVLTSMPLPFEPSPETKRQVRARLCEQKERNER